MKTLREHKDLTPDPENANVGTKRGADLVQRSLETLGAGRSIVVDKHGVVIAGNKTLEAAVDLGLPIRVVQTAGEKLAVVQRIDLDLDAGDRARQLAYLDNRASEVGLAWDPHQLLRDLERGLAFGAFFFDDELERIVNQQLGAEAAADAVADSAPKAHVAVLKFASEEQEALWIAFLRWLRLRFPEELTIAARLDRYLRDVAGVV